MNAWPTRLVATRSPSAEPRLVSVDQVTTQSMVGGLRQAEREAEHRQSRPSSRQGCCSPRARARQGRPRQTVATTVSRRFGIRRPKKGVRPREKSAAGADASKYADLRDVSPTALRATAHRPQQVDAALRGETGHQRGGHPRLRSRPHTRSASLAHRRHLHAGSHRESGGGQAGDEDPCRRQQGRGGRRKARLSVWPMITPPTTGADDLASAETW